MQANKALNFTVGLFVLAGLIALGFLALKVSNVDMGSGDTYDVTASFSNVGGLNVKAPVAIGGVRVGRVTDIDLSNESFDAVVTMTIESGYQLSVDTSAAVLTSGLLGAQFVGLEPGGDDLTLSDGDEIELTQSTIQLENLIGKFMFNTGGGDEE